MGIKKTVAGFEFVVEANPYEEGNSSTVTIQGKSPDGEVVLDGIWDAQKSDWEWYFLEKCYGICDDPENSELAAQYTAADPDWQAFNEFAYGAEVAEFCRENSYVDTCPSCGAHGDEHGLCAACREEAKDLLALAREEYAKAGVAFPEQELAEAFNAGEVETPRNIAEYVVSFRNLRLEKEDFIADIQAFIEEDRA